MRNIFYNLTFFVRTIFIALITVPISFQIKGLVGVVAQLIVVVFLHLILALEHWLSPRNEVKHYSNIVQVPGKVVFEPKHEMAFNINKEEFLVRPRDTITIDMPEKCTAMGMIFATPYDDSILDADTIGEHIN